MATMAGNLPEKARIEEIMEQAIDADSKFEFYLYNNQRSKAQPYADTRDALIEKLKSLLTKKNVNNNFRVKGCNTNVMRMAIKFNDFELIDYLIDVLDVQYSERAIYEMVKLYFEDQDLDEIREKWLNAISKLLNKSGLSEENVSEMLTRFSMSVREGEEEFFWDEENGPDCYVEEMRKSIILPYIAKSKWNRTRHLVAEYNRGEKKTRKHPRRQNRHKSRKT